MTGTIAARLASVALVPFLILTGTAAEALEDGTLTANSFSRGCHAMAQGMETQKEAVECVSYLTGMLDGLHFSALLNEKPEAFCLPNVPMRQFAITVTKYMDAHPQDQKLLFATVIYKAMLEAYPCGKSKP
jgi:Rap1a immunity proteins